MDEIRLNKSQLARQINVSPVTINKHLARPEAPEPDGDGKYDAMAVALFVGARQNLNNDAGGSAAIAAARLEGIKIENRKKQLDLDRDMGLYVHKDEVLIWISEMFGSLRSRILSLVPTVASSEKDRNLWRDQLTITLNEFANHHYEAAGEKPMPVPAPKPPAKKPAKPKRKRKKKTKANGRKN